MLITLPRLGGTIPSKSNNSPKHRAHPDRVNISTSSRAIRDFVFRRDALEDLAIVMPPSFFDPGPLAIKAAINDRALSDSVLRRLVGVDDFVESTSSSVGMALMAAWMASRVLYAVRSL